MRNREAVLLAVALGGVTASGLAQGVRVVANEAERRVDITIDGHPFTSYIWPTTLKKPVLYPLITEDGITVTRGYPLEPRPGERIDHPHHAGVWFNYGDVNGFDFWNNSDAIKPEDRHKMGTIEQEKIVSTTSGADRGELVADSTWITGEGKPILAETASYVFTGRPYERVIDVVVKLKALDRAVFHDDKEGVLGMRVAGWLESAEEKGGEFTDSSGRPTKVEGASPGASGVYLTSEGRQGAAAWGTRGRWCSLSGHTGDRALTIVIFDHPENPGYPTYWHARGYGLFAANPLGRSIFDPKQPALNFTLDKDQTATFRYRIILMSHKTTAERLNGEADAFAAEYK
jgi:hypothetical protein